MNFLPDLLRAIEGNDLYRLKNVLSSAPAVLNCRTLEDGRTPLHHAAVRGSVVCTHELLMHAAPIEATDLHGCIPLHLAAQAGSSGVIKCLLQAAEGRNIVSARSREGLTPLHFAAIHGSPDAVHMLLSAGAQPDVKDKAGYLPIDLVKPGNAALLDMLQKASGALMAPERQLVPHHALVPVVRGAASVGVHNAIVPVGYARPALPAPAGDAGMLVAAAKVAQVAQQVDSIANEVKLSDKELKDVCAKLGDQEDHIKDLFSKVQKLDTWFKAQLEIIPEWQKALSTLNTIKKSSENTEHRMKVCESQVTNFMADFAAAKKDILNNKQGGELMASQLAAIKSDLASLVAGAPVERIRELNAKLGAVEDKVVKAAEDLTERLDDLEEEYRKKMSSKYLQEETLATFMDTTAEYLDAHDGSLQKVMAQVAAIQDYRDKVALMGVETARFKEEAGALLANHTATLRALTPEVASLGDKIQQLAADLDTIHEELRSELDQQDTALKQLIPEVKGLQGRTLEAEEKLASMEAQNQTFQQSTAEFMERHENKLQQLGPQVAALEKKSARQAGKLQDLNKEVATLAADTGSELQAIKKSQQEGQASLSVSLELTTTKTEQQLKSLEDEITTKVVDAQEQLTTKIKVNAAEADEKLANLQDETKVHLKRLEDTLTEHVEDVKTSLDKKVEGLEAHLDQRINGVESTLTDRVQKVDEDAKKKAKTVEEELKQQVQAVADSSSERLLKTTMDLQGQLDTRERELKESIEQQEKDLGRRIDSTAAELEHTISSSVEQRAAAMEGDFKENLAAHEKSIQGLTPRVGHLEQCMKATATFMKSHDKQLKEAQSSLGANRVDLDKHEQQLGTLNTKVQQHGESLSKLTGQLKDQQEVLIADHARLEVLDGRVVELSTATGANAEKLKGHDAQLEHVDDMLGRNEAYKDKLEAKLKTHENRLDTLAPKIDSISAQQVSLQDEAKAQRTQVDQLVPEVAVLVGRNNQLGQQVDDHRAQLQQLVPQVRALEAQHQSTEKTLQDHTVSLDRLTPQVARMQTAVDETTRAIKANTSSLESLVPQVAEVQEDIKNMRFAEVQAQVSRLGPAVEKVTHDVEEQKTQVVDLKKATKENKEMMDKAIVSTQSQLAEQDNRLVKAEDFSASQASRLARLSEDMEAFREDTLEPFMKSTRTFLEQHSKELERLVPEVSQSSAQISQHHERLSTLKTQVSEVNHLLTSYYNLMEPQIAGNAKDMEEHKEKLQVLSYQMAGFEELIRQLLVNELEDENSSKQPQSSKTPLALEVSKATGHYKTTGHAIHPALGRDGLVNVAAALIKMQARVMELTHRLNEGPVTVSGPWRTSHGGGVQVGMNVLVEELAEQRKDHGQLLKELTAQREQNKVLVEALARYENRLQEQKQELKALREQSSKVAEETVRTKVDEAIAMVRNSMATSATVQLGEVQQQVDTVEKSISDRLEALTAANKELKGQNKQMTQAVLAMQQVIEGMIGQPDQPLGALKNLKDAMDAVAARLVNEKPARTRSSGAQMMKYKDMQREESAALSPRIGAGVVGGEE